MKPDRHDWLRDLGLVLCLFLIGGCVKGWLFTHTKVLARDGVGYIQYASRLEREPWSKVLRETDQHPLYPIHVLAASRVVESLTGGLTPFTWQASAQLANMGASILLAWPMLLLGKQLFNRRVGFWAAVMFQCLPVPARVTSDTLSEGAYLLWAVTALYFAVRGLQSQRAFWFVLCGGSGGLAYLVRPEGSLVLGITGLTLFVMQLARTWRAPWRRVLSCGAALAVTGMLTAAPYWLTIGGFSNKPSVNQFVSGEPSDASALLQPVGSALMFASRFMPGTDGLDHAGVNAWYALYEVLDEISKAFYYVVWIPIIPGAVWLWRKAKVSRGVLVLVLIIVVNLLILWRLSVRAHYVSERHTLLILLCGVILSMGVLFRVLPQRLSPRRALGGIWRGFKLRWVVRGLLVLLLSCSQSQTLKPLHGHRAGHKELGLWLKDHLQPGDHIVDPYGLATFYAGRDPVLSMPIIGPRTRPPRRFLVVELADLDAARRKIVETASTKTGKGNPVFSWPPGPTPQLMLYEAPRH